MNMQMMDDNPHFINEISCEDNFDPHCNPFSETNGIRKFTSNTIKEVSEALKIDLNKLRDCVRGDQLVQRIVDWRTRPLKPALPPDRKPIRNGVFDPWGFCADDKMDNILLSEDKKTAILSAEYSYGSVSLRGNQMLNNRNSYFEIQVTPAFGNSIMIGLGTRALDPFYPGFGQKMGMLRHSVGVSHKGWMSYNAIHVRIHKPWSEHDGSTVGVWFNGDRVVFFKDSQRIAEAEGFSACKDPLYPYFFSTAAFTCMRISDQQTEITPETSLQKMVRHHLLLSSGLDQPDYKKLSEYFGGIDLPVTLRDFLILPKSDIEDRRERAKYLKRLGLEVSEDKMRTAAALMFAHQTTAKGGPPLFGHYYFGSNTLAVPPQLLCRGNCKTYVSIKGKSKQSCSKADYDRMDYADLGAELYYAGQ